MSIIAHSERSEKRSKADIFKPEFDALAVNGFIGDPDGIPAYAYIRVSSEKQAEEGRSGLPRQIANIHETAQKQGYRISWQMVFADDASGFEFESRPALSRLRKEYANPRARVVIIEEIDRLSRNADWHQGFLLEEMKKHGIKPVFWKAFNSRIEQAVMGAVAQDAQQTVQARLQRGTLEKAKSKRITAKFAAYGYKLVDSQGREHGSSVRKDTHYAINEDEAAIVRYMYERYAMGISLRKLQKELIARNVSFCRAEIAAMTTLRKILMNPTYKGEFVTNRTRQAVRYEQQKDGSVKKIKTREARPPEDWIIVPVPPIVSPELWQAAQERFSLNPKYNSGRDDRKYLLTGLLVCAHCGYKYAGNRNKQKTVYRCGRSAKYYSCTQPSIKTERLEAAVWSAVTDTLLRPELIVAALEQQYQGDHNRQLADQIAHLQGMIAEKETEDRKLYKAYMADVFDEVEYKAQRSELKASIRQFEAEIATLQKRLITPEQYEEKKQQILALAAQARNLGASGLTLKQKRNFLLTVIDRIVLDTKAGTFRIEGALPGVYKLSGKLFTPASKCEQLNIPFTAQYSLKSNALLSVSLS